MNATVEGQTTAHYIVDRLAGAGVQVTRLAHGVPVGGELDYLDEGTLSAALAARQVLEGRRVGPVLGGVHSAEDGGTRSRPTRPTARCGGC